MRSHRRRRSPCGPLARTALALLTTTSFVARAQDRAFVDLEPVTPRFVSGGGSRVAVSTVGVTFGWGRGALIPYVGGGFGLLTAQARAGVVLLPDELTNAGPIVRLELRPQVFLSPCVEPALLANAGFGYRWPLEPSYPGVRSAGSAFYLLASFDGGEAWLRPRCISTGPSEPRQPKLLLGGTVAVGFDW